jgi:hypothetical protein
MSSRLISAFLFFAVAVSAAFSSDIPKNTKLEIKLEEMLSSDISQSGQKFQATLNKAVSIEHVMLLEKGALVEGVVKYAEPTYDYRQPGELDLELVTVASGGKTYFIRTNTIMLAGKPSPVDPRTERPMDPRSRTGDLARATIGTVAGGNSGASTTIPGTDVSVGTGTPRNGTQVILPAKSKLTFNLVSASANNSSQQ